MGPFFLGGGWTSIAPIGFCLCANYMPLLLKICLENYCEGGYFSPFYGKKNSPKRFLLKK
jgi:hypothetical protein